MAKHSKITAIHCHLTFEQFAIDLHDLMQTASIDEFEKELASVAIWRIGNGVTSNDLSDIIQISEMWHFCKLRYECLLLASQTGFQLSDNGDITSWLVFADRLQELGNTYLANFIRKEMK